MARIWNTTRDVCARLTRWTRARAGYDASGMPLVFTGERVELQASARISADSEWASAPSDIMDDLLIASATADDIVELETDLDWHEERESQRITLELPSDLDSAIGAALAARIENIQDRIEIVDATVAIIATADGDVTDGATVATTTALPDAIITETPAEPVVAEVAIESAATCDVDHQIDRDTAYALLAEEPAEAVEADAGASHAFDEQLYDEASIGNEMVTPSLAQYELVVEPVLYAQAMPIEYSERAGVRRANVPQMDLKKAVTLPPDVFEIMTQRPQMQFVDAVTRIDPPAVDQPAALPVNANNDGDDVSPAALCKMLAEEAGRRARSAMNAYRRLVESAEAQHRAVREDAKRGLRIAWGFGGSMAALAAIGSAWGARELSNARSEVVAMRDKAQAALASSVERDQGRSAVARITNTEADQVRQRLDMAMAASANRDPAGVKSPSTQPAAAIPAPLPSLFVAAPRPAQPSESWASLLKGE